MWKKLIIGFFLGSLLAGYGVFLNRDLTPIRETLEKKEGPAPGIEMDHFTVRRFEKDRLVSVLTATKGFLYSPNILKMENGVSGWRRAPQGGDQVLKGDKAEVTFKADSIDKVLLAPSMDEAFIETNVEMQTPLEHLKTERINYKEIERRVYATTPVKILGVHRDLKGEGGFQFFLDSEKLDIFGKVTGTFHRTKP